MKIKKSWKFLSLFFMCYAMNSFADPTDEWFSIFNVSNKQLPGSFYGYSIISTQSGCASPCAQMALPEQPNGVSSIPVACMAASSCPLFLNIYLKGKIADSSCENIDLNNISEIWLRFNNDRFSATCQAFYHVQVPIAPAQ